MTKDYPRKLAMLIADDLFEDGFGRKAKRLQLKGPAEEDLGGWCKGAAVDRIEQIVKSFPSRLPK